MTPREKHLIRDAYRTPYTEWMTIDKLIDKASSKECKKKLKEIRLSKFREEEYRNGDL